MSESHVDSPLVGVVVLTMGDRPRELQSCVASALRQDQVDVELVVVANGTGAADVHVPADDRVSVVASAVNLGIPGGRNEGMDRTTASIVAFVDDDARYLDASVLARCASAFAARRRLGAIALHVVDERGRTARRHVPRIGARHPDRSGDVTAFLGGAVVIRREAFADAGGYAAAFVYSMEETDLALRLIDRDWEIAYDGVPAVLHPAVSPERHGSAMARTMRNRVWMVHRALPAPLAVLYVVDWLAISIVRAPRSAPTLIAAALHGWRTKPGPRAPIRWRTVARLARLGRPPIV